MAFKITLTAGIVAIIAIIVLGVSTLPLILPPLPALLRPYPSVWIGDLSRIDTPPDGSLELKYTGFIEATKDAAKKYVVQTYDKEVSDREAAEWSHSIGLFGDEDIEPYKSYDVGVLEELGQQCNLKALYVLILKKNISREALKKASYISAVCGATTTLSLLVPRSGLSYRQTSEE